MQIQAPPLSREDQAQGLPALKASLLGQQENAEQQARRSASAAGGKEVVAPWHRSAAAQGLDGAHAASGPC